MSDGHTSQDELDSEAQDVVQMDLSSTPSSRRVSRGGPEAKTPSPGRGIPDQAAIRLSTSRIPSDESPSHASSDGYGGRVRGAGGRRGSLKLAKETKEEMNRAAAEAAAALRINNSQLHAFLQSKTVTDLKLPSRVITISSDADPEEAFAKLTEANILSAPVYDNDEKKYIGYLHVRDMLSSIVYAHQKELMQDLDKFSLQGLINTLATRMEEHAVTVKYLARRHPYSPVTRQATLLEVAARLAGDSHRVAVVDDEGNVTGIVSLSTMIKYLNNNMDQYANDVKISLGDMNVCLKEVLQAPDSSTAFTVFQMLDESGLSGIAIVDDEGAVIGNTSAVDIKTFAGNRGDFDLEMPIMDYLARLRQLQAAPSGADRYPVTTLPGSASLEKAIAVLAKTGYHRAFVVDNEAPIKGKPIGVVAITDILKFATV